MQLRSIPITSLIFNEQNVVTEKKRESLLVHNILRVSPVTNRGPNIPTYITFARSEQRGVFVDESVEDIERRINSLDRKALIVLDAIDVGADNTLGKRYLELINPARIVRVREWPNDPAYTLIHMEDETSIYVTQSLREIYEIANGEEHD